MRRQNKILGIFVGMIFISIIFSGLSSQIITENKPLTHPLILIEGINSADGELPVSYSKFDQNATNIYRLFQSIEFNVNASEFVGANYTVLRIHYSNNSVEEFNMDHISGTNFTYIFSPRYDNPLGFHNVSFLVYNNTNVLLSSPAPITNFTVHTNYFLTFNNSEYRRGNDLYAELSVYDEPSPYNFNWNITVVDNDNETLASNILDIGNDLLQFSCKIDERFEFTDKIYYIKLNMSDVSNNIRKSAYFPFKVSNTAPQINSSSIIFSSKTIKRAEDCILSLNVSDIDIDTFPENMTVTLLLKDPSGDSESIIMDNTENWNFTTTFAIDISKPLGIYQVEIDVEDQYGGIGTYTTTITVQNNLPEIHSYTINGFSREQSVSINYGEDIIFTFNVSDVENTISLITVHLLDEENNWYNVSKPYSKNMDFFIRTEELLTGVWYVYITVTDADLGTTYLTSDFGFGPQEIRIIPDLLSPVIPWVSFIIGIVLGLLAGIGILYNVLRKRFETTSKKPQREKKTKKPQKETKKPAPVEIKVEEETEEPKTQPQRKIKRKL